MGGGGSSDGPNIKKAYFVGQGVSPLNSPSGSASGTSVTLNVAGIKLGLTRITITITEQYLKMT